MSSIYRKGRDGYYYYQTYIYNPKTKKKDKRVFHALRTKDIVDAKSKQHELDLQYQEETDQKYKLPKPTYKFTASSLVLIIIVTIFITLTFTYLLIPFNQMKTSTILSSNEKKIKVDKKIEVRNTVDFAKEKNTKQKSSNFEKIADTVEIPQILYNVPSRTACDLRPETLMRLANHQNIVGIKEALDDRKRLSELVRISQSIKDQKNFSVFSGDDPSFNSFMANGGDGVISVAANVVPKHISQICSLNLSNQLDDAKKLNSTLENLYELLFIESNPMPVKWMLSKMGRIQPGIRLPLITFNQVFHEKTINEMIKLKLI